MRPQTPALRLSTAAIFFRQTGQRLSVSCGYALCAWSSMFSSPSLPKTLLVFQRLLGLGYQLELRNHFGLDIKAAKKTEKASAIRLMNDQLRAMGDLRRQEHVDIESTWAMITVMQAYDFVNPPLFRIIPP